MNRLLISAGIAAAACAIALPAASALASDDSSTLRTPTQSRVDDHGGTSRGSDDSTAVTAAPSDTSTKTRVVTPTGAATSTSHSGRHTGVSVSSGADNRGNGTHIEPGDDHGTGVEAGDDSGGHGAQPASDHSASPSSSNNSAPDDTGSGHSASDDTGSDHSGSDDGATHGGHHGSDG